MATGALIVGFVAFDAPARERALWQLAASPIIGTFAALGVLSGDSAILAVGVMIASACAAGFCVALPPRVAIIAMQAVLALLIAQGLRLSPDDAARALLWGTAGGLLQAGVSLLASISDKSREAPGRAAGFRSACAAGARDLTLQSEAFRHALRWGVALGAAVAVYRLVDLQGHGYWVPLTVLFVLRPQADDTRQRLTMRAAGTIVGLALATGLAEILGHQMILTAIILAITAAFCFALIALEYALFTMAITVFIVLLSDALGERALNAAGQRALATAIGIGIAALAFSLYPSSPLRGARRETSAQ